MLSFNSSFFSFIGHFRREVAAIRQKTLPGKQANRQTLKHIIPKTWNQLTFIAHITYHETQDADAVICVISKPTTQLTHVVLTSMRRRTMLYRR